MFKRSNVAFFIIFFLSFTVYAQIYYWVDAKGVKHYSSSPPESKEGIRDYQVVETVSEISAAAPVNPSDNNTRAPQAFQTRTYPNVVMYTTSWCPVCKEAKAWFLRNNVPFEEYDVEKDPDRGREYKKLSGKGVPLILIGDNQLSGWSETRVRNWLGMNK